MRSPDPYQIILTYRHQPPKYALFPEILTKKAQQNCAKLKKVRMCRAKNRLFSWPCLILQKNSTDLHRALTSAPSNTFGTSWNTDCQARLHRPTSVLDLTNALVAEREQIPAATFPKSVLLVESLHGRVEAVLEGFQLRCSPTTYGKLKQLIQLSAC